MCKLQTITYTCTHTKPTLLSHCRETYTKYPNNNNNKNNNNKNTTSSDDPPNKTLCKGKALPALELHSQQACHTCQEAANQKTRQEQLRAAEQHQLEVTDRWRKMLWYPHRAGVEKIALAARGVREAREEVQRLEREGARAGWEAEKMMVKGFRDPGDGKRRRRGRVEWGSLLRREVLPEDVVVQERMEW